MKRFPYILYFDTLHTRDRPLTGNNQPAIHRHCGDEYGETKQRVPNDSDARKQMNRCRVTRDDHQPINRY
jgi:hypothetical protein